jgi:transcriptional regulator with XRE-family HTH domain
VTQWAYSAEDLRSLLFPNHVDLPAQERVRGPEAFLIERVLFGNRLRLARERSRLSLDQIANDTKLNASIIAALEDGSCARWPIGVYSRSYVRSYAELVGLDPAETVVEFATLFPEVAFLEVERAAGRDRDASAPARRRPPAKVAPLRLVLEDSPPSWWRRLMTSLAWWLHRVANGGAVPTLQGNAGNVGDGRWLADAREDAASFAALQVDHD